MNLLKSTVASAVFVVCCLEKKCTTSRYLGDQKDKVNRDILCINFWSAEAKKQYMQKRKQKFERLVNFKPLQKGIRNYKFSPLTWIDRYINCAVLSEPTHK